jgi:hypothetical protein
MLLIAEQGFHSYGTYMHTSKGDMKWRLNVLGLLAFTKILGMDPTEADKLCREAVAATKNKSIHSYCPQYAAPALGLY